MLNVIEHHGGYVCVECWVYYLRLLAIFLRPVFYAYTPVSYNFNTRIFKNCFLYLFPDGRTVFYGIGALVSKNNKAHQLAILIPNLCSLVRQKAFFGEAFYKTWSILLPFLVYESHIAFACKCLQSYVCKRFFYRFHTCSFQLYEL